MAVTIRDVAKRAGCSVATVSRALNQSGPVRADTRRRIEEAVAEMKYRPNVAARSLITRRTGMLGVLLPDLHGEFFSELIRGLDDAAQAHGYHLLLSSSHDLAEELEAALHGMQGRVDGLVIMAPKLDAATLNALLPRSTPVVLLNSPHARASVCDLRIDNYGGASSMVSHLASHGHKRIAIITGPTGNHDAEERLTGYRNALAEAGIECDPALEIEGDFRTSSGYHATNLLLALADRPSAIFAANDAMALGALSALRDAGVAVPGDIALAGFDDLSSTRYSIPPLSSVHVSISELGARAIASLSEVVANGAPPVEPHEVLSATAVLRRSCGCAGRDGERRAQPTEPAHRGSHPTQEDRP
ncbi:MAG: LacI family DNA-binding transcriptional regulator [Longimicrobiales bacterium]